MPRNVRNFWLSARIDGRASILASGPKSKDGGLSATLYVRKDGDVATAIMIDAWPGTNGKLHISVTTNMPTVEGTKTINIVTSR